MNEIVHLYKSRVDSDLKILFLIIPIIIFVLVAVILLSGSPKPDSISTLATP